MKPKEKENRTNNQARKINGFGETFIYACPFHV
jgi:hypothetical protein